MSEFCLLAASLLNRGQIPGWQLATPPPTSASQPSLAATRSKPNCHAAVKGTIAAAEVQHPEFTPRSPQPNTQTTPLAVRMQRIPDPAIAPSRQIPAAIARLQLPGLDTTGQPYLPYVPPTTARPFTGSQLYQQRVAALRAGRVYTRLSADSYENVWLNATMQPTYSQWISLLTAEAGAIARGQGANRLTVMVGDSLCLWYPQEQLSSDRFWLNQGISGDTTVGVLQRLSAFAQTRPDQIQVMVGINDLRQGATDQQVLSHLQQIIRHLHQSHPTAQIFVQSILPTRLAAIPASRIRAVNDRLSHLTQQEGANFVDLQGYFTDGSGNLRYDLTTDGVHLNSQGYATWRMALRAFNPAL